MDWGRALIEPERPWLDAWAAQRLQPGAGRFLVIGADQHASPRAEERAGQVEECQDRPGGEDLPVDARQQRPAEAPAQIDAAVTLGAEAASEPVFSEAA